MSQKTTRPTKPENSISILILGIIVFIAVIIFYKQASYDMSRFGIDADIAGKIAAKRFQYKSDPEAEKAGLKEFLPQGFSVMSPAETYNQETLFEKINGKAPLYLDAGFQKLKTQRFVNQTDQNLWMEIYMFDMMKNQNAFSVYSTQKRSGARDIKGIENAYQSGNAVYAVHGKYYIEMVGSSDTLKLLDAMVQTLQNIQRKLKTETKQDVDEKQLLKLENIIPGSENFYVASAFGFRGFNDIYAARYKYGQQEVIAFLSKRQTPQAAEKLMAEYIEFLKSNDAQPIKIDSPALSATDAKIYDFYGMWEIIFTKGSYLAGVHMASSKENAIDLATKLLEKIESKK